MSRRYHLEVRGTYILRIFLLPRIQLDNHYFPSNLWHGTNIPDGCYYSPSFFNVRFRQFKPDTTYELDPIEMEWIGRTLD
jgi:hypothetical protein